MAASKGLPAGVMPLVAIEIVLLAVCAVLFITTGQQVWLYAVVAVALAFGPMIMLKFMGARSSAGRADEDATDA